MCRLITTTTSVGQLRNGKRTVGVSTLILALKCVLDWRLTTTCCLKEETSNPTPKAILPEIVKDAKWRRNEKGQWVPTEKKIDVQKMMLKLGLTAQGDAYKIRKKLLEEELGQSSTNEEQVIGIATHAKISMVLAKTSRSLEHPSTTAWYL